MWLHYLILIIINKNEFWCRADISVVIRLNVARIAFVDNSFTILWDADFNKMPYGTVEKRPVGAGSERQNEQLKN